MMSLTHCAIAVAASSVAIGTADPFVLTAAAIASQLPDLDTTESFMGRVFYPVAKWIEERYPHRTITHSFVASTFVAVVGLPLLLIHWHYWLALVLGHFCGWFSDAFTKAGVAAFHPSPARFVIPGNPRVRLQSKSPAEYWVLAIAVLATVISVNLSSAGGLSEQFSLSFFQDPGTAAEMFRKYGSRQQVLVHVRGLNTRSSQAVDDEFVVIESQNQDFVGESQATGKMYKIGTSADAQIQATSIKTRLGDRLTVKATEQSIQDIEVVEWAKRLPPNAYLSGTLLLDDAEVSSPLEVESFQTIRASDTQVELHNARPSQVVAVLGESWILSGSVVVKLRV